MVDSHPQPAHEADASRGFGTRAVHLGIEPDPITGAISPAIVQTSTYVQDGTQSPKVAGFEYSRSANPTRSLLQRHIAGLEEGAHGFSFASGLAASDAILRTVLAGGGYVVVGNDAYGGTFRLIGQVWSRFGVAMTAVDLRDLAAVREAFSSLSGEAGEVLLWVESPSNPLLQVVDLAALAAVGHQYGAIVVVDNTFASPYLQQPLSLGADVVLHSASKYLSGHSDLVGGALVVNDDELAERIGFIQNAVGAVSGPMDCWLAIRGLKTLALRMDRHCDNAEKVAEFLSRHEAVAAVHYPGLADHPQHELAGRQMRRFGGMMSLQLIGGAEAARKLAESTRIFLLAESLGGVESLIEHPDDMTHLAVRGTPRAVADDLVRLSVGIEDAEDLIADLQQALSSV